MTKSIGVPVILSPIPEELSPTLSLSSAHSASGTNKRAAEPEEGEHTTPPQKKKQRRSSEPSPNTTPNSKKSSTKIRAEARKLKEIAKRMGNDEKRADAPCNLDSYWYFFKSGLKFIEFSDSLLHDTSSRSPTNESSEMYFSTAAFFNFCIYKYEKCRRTYLISLAHACKAWCYYQAFNLRKSEIFRNSNRMSSLMDQPHPTSASTNPPTNPKQTTNPGNLLIPPNSAGSYNSNASGTEWSPDNPITPSSAGSVSSPTISMSKTSFDGLKKFVQRDSKAMIGFMSALEYSRKARPSPDISERNGLTLLELETVLLTGQLTCQEFLQHIHQEVDKGKDVKY